MAIKRQDKNGNYRIVDPVTGEFLDEPLTHNVGQIPHQTSYTIQGKVIDQDEVGAEIIETNGETVLSDDDAQIKQYIKEAISIDNLVETFNENSHLTLLKLLALQDNKHPLKKGGVGIAYRTDTLLPLEMNACLPGCVWNATPRSLSPLERNIGFWTQA